MEHGVKGILIDREATNVLGDVDLLEGLVAEHLLRQPIEGRVVDAHGVQVIA